MNSSSLVELINKLGIEIASNDEALTFKAPKGAMTAGIRALIKANRATILAELKVGSSVSKSIAASPRSFPRGEEPERAAERTYSQIDLQNLTEVFAILRRWENIGPP